MRERYLRALTGPGSTTDRPCSHDDHRSDPGLTLLGHRVGDLLQRLLAPCLNVVGSWTVDDDVGEAELSGPGWPCPRTGRHCSMSIPGSCPARLGAGTRLEAGSHPSRGPASPGRTTIRLRSHVPGAVGDPVVAESQFEALPTWSGAGCKQRNPRTPHAPGQGPRVPGGVVPALARDMVAGQQIQQLDELGEPVDPRAGERRSWPSTAASKPVAPAPTPHRNGRTCWPRHAVMTAGSSSLPCHDASTVY
jgi:hypothetical protein